jgi:flavin reductase (DIM6/NTAB) family NADH-FMN oxidoreductase RutF
MSRTYYSESELESLYNQGEVMSGTGYTLRPPWPQALLVSADPGLEENTITVRTTTFNPLSWAPFTMSVTIQANDDKVVRGMKVGGECVLGLPSRDMLRPLTICAQRFPRGVSEVQVARLKLAKSQHVQIPSLDDCPVNFECEIAHIEPYYSHFVYFLRFVGASIKPELLFLSRQEIVSIYPTNLIDEVVDANGVIKQRIGLIKELYLCPTFPVGPKLGWYSNFKGWMKDLSEENYLEPEECQKAIDWFEDWKIAFPHADSLERTRLKNNFTELCRLLSNEAWEELHQFMGQTS